MEAIASISQDDQISDLRREVAELKRTNANLNTQLEHDAMRLHNEVTAYQETISELREDLISARQKRAQSETLLQDSLRATRKHQEERGGSASKDTVNQGKGEVKWRSRLEIAADVQQV